MEMKKLQSSKAILDSSILIGCLRNNQQAMTILSDLRKRKVHPCVSVISIAEILAGIVTEKHKTQTKEFLAEFEWIDFTSRMAQKSGEFLQLFKNDKQKRSQMFPDALIAATAEYYKMDIYTGNKKHFDEFSLQHINIFGY